MSWVSGISALETLEQRQLLAVISHTGTLLVAGDADLGDRITINQKAGTIIVQTGAGKFTETFPAAAVKRILVETFGGDDNIRVQQEVKERVTLAGGAGNDWLNGTFGSTLIGGAGNDQLFVPPRTAYDVESKALVAREDAPDVAALLSGGLGDDSLFADRGDTVVGGRGNDNAGMTTTVILPPDQEGPITFGSDVAFKSRDEFGDRASGIEFFSGEDDNATTIQLGTAQYDFSN